MLSPRQKAQEIRVRLVRASGRSDFRHDIPQIQYTVANVVSCDVHNDGQ
jgi:hypothetical protein